MLQICFAALPLLAQVANAVPIPAADDGPACSVVWVTESADQPEPTGYSYRQSNVPINEDYVAESSYQPDSTTSAQQTDVPIRQGYIEAPESSSDLPEATSSTRQTDVPIKQDHIKDPEASVSSTAWTTETAHALVAQDAPPSTTPAYSSVPIKQAYDSISESSLACRVVWVTEAPETTVKPPGDRPSVKPFSSNVPSKDEKFTQALPSATTMQTPSQVAPTQSPRKTPYVPASSSTGPSKEVESSRLVVSPAQKNAVYFTNWGSLAANNTLKALPVNEITHLLYAFGDISSEGEVISSDPVADFQNKLENCTRKRDETDREETAHGYIGQLYKLKEKNRNHKTLLSIGGASYSQTGKFAPATQTAEGRRRFAKSAVRHVANWGLDGVDIDWEYPMTKEEAQNFVQLLNETRSALDEYAASNGQNYRYVLSAATSAVSSQYNLLDIEAMDQYLDIWNLMAYDYAGSWDSTTGHQANIYPDADNRESTKFSTNQAVDDYIAAGVSPEKIVLGMPLYGRPFTNTMGMGQKFVSAGARSGESDVWPYNELPLPVSTVYVDENLIAAYNYDAENGLLISYDNTDIANLKAKYLTQKGLGGAVFWEASGDRPGEESLIRTVANSMGQLEDAQNMLKYPQSEYQNIRGTKYS